MHTEYLIQNFEKRKLKNPRYSLRAYARDLGIDASTLAKILKNQRPFPLKYIGPVTAKLDLTIEEKQEFSQSILGSSNWLDLFRESKTEKMIHLLDAQDDFEIIAEWEYYAVLSLMETRGFEWKTSFIARKLGLTNSRAKEVMTKLKARNFVSVDSKGSAHRLPQPLGTTEDIWSQALQVGHFQEMLLAQKALHHLDPEIREISSITFAGDPKSLIKAKKMIRDFQKKLSQLMESGRKEQVYTLAVQLWPLTSP